MDDLVTRFARALSDLPAESGDGVVVAVSGGVDSLVLLALLHEARAAHGLELSVFHVDHGIHPSSGTVAAEVAAAASRLGLPFGLAELQLGAAAGETEARARRYDALEAYRRSSGADWIMTAHHADDQAETVLMRLLRGSGPAGLAAMAPVRGRVLRPLLGVSRARIEAHAAERGIVGWIDPANSDPRHDRAWVRTVVLPALAARRPDVADRLSDAARQAADERAGWDAALDGFPDLDVDRDPTGVSVAASALAGYDSRLARALLRAAGRRAGIVIGPRRADRILDLVREGRSGSSTPLGGTSRAELAFGRLRIVPAGDAPRADLVLSIGGGPSGETSWRGWDLRWVSEAAPARQPRNGMTAWFVPSMELRVREWRPGDRLHPLGGTGRRLLVRCFQDARVPRGRRADWPVIEAGGQVVWAPGVCRGAALVPEAGSEAVRVDVAYT